MRNDRANTKVKLEHLDRLAYIYVRQSSLFQVRENTGSTLRQYDLTKLAEELGWPKERIMVIDEDQGHSGASSADRAGFQKLVSEVSLGRVGAVISIEVSRLARSSSDWHRLLELCALSNCLVIDQEGAYNLKDINDRMILGVKGNLFEYELHFLKERLHGAKMRKAEQGKVRVRLPVGYIYDDLGKAVFDPDEQVQESIALAFKLFKELGTTGEVVRYFKKNNLLFPRRKHHGSRNNGILIWESLDRNQILRMLDSPTYAGVYAYARSILQKKTSEEDSSHLITSRRSLPIEEWPIIKHDIYPAYISWEQYLNNRKSLDANQTKRERSRPGAVREGGSLLQGIVVCGKCGNQMSVCYQGRSRLVYTCQKHYARFGGKTCQHIKGAPVDKAVSEFFLQAITPAQLSISLQTLNQLEQQAKQVERQYAMKLERSQYEADRIRRQYDQCEPENRLVARTIERSLEEKLQEVERLKREYDNRPRPKILSLASEDREKILNLAKDLPQIWNASSTTNKERKQLVRLLIKNVTLKRKERTIQIDIFWQTGANTSHEIDRPIPGLEQKTPQYIVNKIRDLSSLNTDRKISELLKQEGIKTAQGKDFTPLRVTHLRRRYRICTLTSRPTKGMKEPRGDGRYCSEAAAEMLNASPTQIVRWCLDGKLDAIRDTAQGPWWIKITPEVVAQYAYPFKEKFGKNGKEARNDGRYCVAAVTEMLNVGSSTIIKWCNQGKLDAVQDFAYGPWWIKITSEIIEQLIHPQKQNLEENETGIRGDGRYNIAEAIDMLDMKRETIIQLCRQGQLNGIQDYPDGPWWIEITPEIVQRFANRTKTKNSIQDIREDVRYCSMAIADMLNVHHITVSKWCEIGKLDGIQDYPHGPWWIKITPEIAKKLAQPIRKESIRTDGRYSITTVAEMLNLHPETIARWCRQGKLDGIQEYSHGTWWIKITPEIIDNLSNKDKNREH